MKKDPEELFWKRDLLKDQYIRERSQAFRFIPLGLYAVGLGYVVKKFCIHPNMVIEEIVLRNVLEYSYFIGGGTSLLVGVCNGINSVFTKKKVNKLEIELSEPDNSSASQGARETS